MDINNWKHATDAYGNEGLLVEKTFDLSQEKPTKFLISPNLLQYSRAAVEIICTEATALTGSVKIHETNLNLSSDSQKYDTGLTVALGVNTNNYTPVPNLYLMHLALEFPALVSTGKITVRIIGKE